MLFALLMTLPYLVTGSHTMSDSADPVSQLVGDFGRWQFMLTFLLSLFNFPCTFHIFSPTFQAEPGRFWCARPHDLRDLLDLDQWESISGKFKLNAVGILLQTVQTDQFFISSFLFYNK